MPRKRKFPDLVERCRICLARDRCMSDIFTEATRPHFNDLGTCTSTQIINNPGLPKNVCHVCLYKLEMWSEFKTQFIKSNNILLYHFKINEQNEPQAKRQLLDTDNLVNHPNKDNKNSMLLNPIVFDVTIAEEAELMETDLNTESKFAVLTRTSQTDEKMSDVKEKSLGDNRQSESPKSKSSIGCRSRTNERRKASTKRWVERQKALIAATGEPVSDTESSAEDEQKLSPVQKARAKTNLEKEEEKRKRVERALKNLETNMTGSYKIKHDEASLILGKVSDERKTRSRKSNIEDVKAFKVQEVNVVESNEKEIEIKQDEVEFELNMDTREHIAEAETPMSDQEEGELTEVEDAMLPDHMTGNRFPTQQVQSEIQMDNATYVITSVLSFADTLDGKSNGLNINEVSNGSNTDIIDAVELKRIIPKNCNKKLVKDLERCLNIEVEGTEVEALQRVQLELANFLEKDIHLRLKSSDSEMSKSDLTVDSKAKDSYETLDLQLKTIVEKVIRKNHDTDKAQNSNSIMNILESISDANISPKELEQRALKSKSLQPKVLLRRLNFARITRKYRVNNLHILENVKRAKGLVGPLSQTLSKRRTVLPARYSDFKLEFEESEARKAQLGDIPPKTPLASISKVQKTTTPVKSVNTPSKAIMFNSTPQIAGKNLFPTVSNATSVPVISMSLVSPVAPVVPLKQDKQSVTPTSTPFNASTNTLQKVVKSARSVKNISKQPDKISVTKLVPVDATKLIRTDSKKVTVPEIKKATLPDAKLVQTDQTKALSEAKQSSLPEPKITPEKKSVLPEPKKMVVSEPKKPILPEQKKLIPAEPKKMILSEPKKPVELRKPESKVAPQPKKSNAENEAPKNSIMRQRHVCGLCRKEFETKIEAEAHVRSHSVGTPSEIKTKQKMMRCKRCHEIVEARLVKSHICGSSKFSCKLCPATFGSENLLTTHIAVHEAKKEQMKPKQSYTCFVCDKIFIDEEELKDHLQKHCDEMSEDERSPDKMQFQCAICGNTLLSEGALESHVEQHLFGDEDDNPDLITIANEAKGKVEQGFACTKCAQRFASQLLLAMHMSQHEEEDAIAQWEKREGESTAKELSKLNFVCSICDEDFDSASKLAVHQESHDGNDLTCILCEVSFASLEELQNHVASHL